MHKLIKFIFFLTVFPYTVFSQSATPTSGSASNINSMDPFSGTANINIALVSKQIDGLELGASISYNTKGIRISDVSSEIGLGWNLNFGGMISRQVKGIPDEICFKPSANSVAFNIGYWHRLNTSIPTDWTPPNSVNNLIDATDSKVAIANGFVDGQMDIFYANFNGSSIQFMINADNEIITIPKDNKSRIQRTIGGSPITTFPKLQNIDEIGFLITDELGNQFYFKKGDNMNTGITPTCNFSLNTTPAPTVNFTLNWVLDKIITSTGKTITYEYVDLGNSTGTITNFSDVQEEFNLTNFNNSSYWNYPSFISEGVSSINKKYIKYINFPDQRIVFSYKDETNTALSRCDVSHAKALYEVSIEEINNISQWNNNSATYYINKKKKVRLDQSYFDATNSFIGGVSCNSNSVYPNEKNLRLKLNKVINATSTPRDIYNFTYYDLADFSPACVEVPSRDCASQDYWGYFNDNPSIGFSSSGGASISLLYGGYIPLTNYIDPLTQVNTLVGVNRIPNAKAKLYLLHKIINENAGCTELEYENNEAQVNGTSMKLDGLRIKKIINSTLSLADNGTTHITEYLYEQGEWINPTNNPIIDDLFRYNKEIKTYINNGINSPPIIQNLEMTSNHFIGQSDEFQHGYGKVTATYSKASKVKDPLTSAISTHTSVIGHDESYFVTLKNVQSGVFNIISTTESGQTYNLNTTDFIAPIPPVPSGTAFAISTSEFSRPYNQYPFTNKQYYPSWVIGLPYKTVNYGTNGKLSESHQEFDLFVHSYNSDKNICANGVITQAIVNSFPGLCNQNVLMDYYYPFSGKMRLRKNTAMVYITPTSVMQKTNEYFYDAITDQLRKTKETASNGVITENYQYYNSDNSNWNNDPAMTALTDNNETVNVYGEIWRHEPNKPNVLVNASGGGFYLSNNKVTRKHAYSLFGNALLQTSPLSTGTFNMSDANSGNQIPNFLKQETITKVDDFGNHLEIKDRNNKYVSYIVDPYSENILATIANASSSEIAYTSFENLQYQSDVTLSSYAMERGNWSYLLDNITINMGITGDKCYKLNETYFKSNSSKVSLVPGKKYTISFWKKGTNPVNVENYNAINGTQGQPIIVSQPISYSELYTNSSSNFILNGWVLCKATFTASYPSIRLNSTATGEYIDELRLYPADAVMSTSVFNTINGKICDASDNNKIIYYENDYTNRVALTRDVQGNILSKSKIVSQLND